MFIHDFISLLLSDRYIAELYKSLIVRTYNLCKQKIVRIEHLYGYGRAFIKIWWQHNIT